MGKSYNLLDYFPASHILRPCFHFLIRVFSEMRITHRWSVYKVLETLFLLWLIVPKYSGALILHEYIDAGFQMFDSIVLSMVPPLYFKVLED